MAGNANPGPDPEEVDIQILRDLQRTTEAAKRRLIDLNHPLELAAARAADLRRKELVKERRRETQKNASLCILVLLLLVAVIAQRKSVVIQKVVGPARGPLVTRSAPAAPPRSICPSNVAALVADGQRVSVVRRALGLRDHRRVGVDAVGKLPLRHECLSTRRSDLVANVGWVLVAHGPMRLTRPQLRKGQDSPCEISPPGRCTGVPSDSPETA